MQAPRCVPCSAHGQAASKQQKPRLMGGIRFQRLMDGRWQAAALAVCVGWAEEGRVRDSQRRAA